MKLAAFSMAVAACLAAGVACAHSDAKQAKKAAAPMEMKETNFGRTGDRKKVSRTVEIDMSDKMRFTPSELTVNQGETVRFVATNSGKQMHEMVLGSMKELKEHAEMMKKHRSMEHDEPYMAHVEPGKKAKIVWQFTKPGQFNFGCLVSGHFEAGMVGKVTVVATAHDTQRKKKDAASASTGAPAKTPGVVKKVDKETARITIQHEPIENLDMPAMTMVFRVKDPAMLDQVKAGDKIRFDAEKIGGQFTVMKVEPAQ